MNVRTLADHGVHAEALAAAEQVAIRPKLGGGALNAPVDAGFVARVEEVWKLIKGALDKAVDRGRTIATELVEATYAEIEQIVSSAGERASELINTILDRLRVYLTAFEDALLRRVRSTLHVGGSLLSLSAVELSHKVSMNGSLKASLQEVIAVASQGELEINATYSVPPR